MSRLLFVYGPPLSSFVGRAVWMGRGGGGKRNDELADKTGVPFSAALLTLRNGYHLEKHAPAPVPN